MQRLLVVATACAGLACGGPEATIEPAPAPSSTTAPATTAIPATAPGDAKPASSPVLVVPGVHLPEGVTPLAYDLRLEVDPDREAFGGTVAIRVRVDRVTDHVWVHADQIVITDARWDDGALGVVTVPAADRMVALTFGKTLQPRELTLRLAFTGATLHDEEGLFRQRAGDRWYLFSQGESEFARRITPCFDEPRWKTPWRVTVVAPKGDVVAGNMPIARDQPLADGRHEVAFVETPPMASYLLAIAVGPFAVVEAGTAGKARVPVRVLTFPRRAHGVAAVARQTGRLVALLEDYTAIPLPFPKLDIVTVPHLFGAMENPGLITFDADIVFDGDRRFAVIAAHELAHQWFGNYVTPVWWDDLWLSEAFASWLGERVAAQNEGHPPSELHVAFTRESALAADAEAGAQPLRRPVTFDPDNAFDSIAYDKGEAVLAMFEHWIGPVVFRTALRAYLHAHANGSATTADLVAAITATAGAEAAQALAAYVDHAGAPVVDLALSCEGGATLTARARDHLQIPVCVRSAGTPRQICALVGEATPIALGATCPSWIVATNGGYYSVVWTTNGPRGPLPPWGKLSLGDKLALATDLSAATSRGDLAPALALAQITELAANHDPYAQVIAVAIAQAIDPLVADAARDRWEVWLARRLVANLTGEPHGMLEDRIRAALLDLIAPAHWPAAMRARATAVVAKQLANKLAPWEAAVRLGGDHAAFTRLARLAHDPKIDPDQREAAMLDLSAFGPAEVGDAMTELLAMLPDRGAWTAFAGYFDRPATRAVAWTTVRDHLGELLARMSPAQAGDMLDATATLCTAAARGEVQAAFAPQVVKILDGKPRLAHALVAIDRCVARRAKAGDIAAALP
ncbi:MAG: M1 family aminopeptidase [Kofleriaceae bacterium]